ncbi:MAG TPA: DNA repair protein RadC [Puia sp.]|jgi:DNA repair protein RadC|nr:DNA repair protein RadC [Puia sp.]
MQLLLPPLRKKTPGPSKWGRDDGPREKLKINGPEILTDWELLCLILGSNTPKKTVMELAREILKENGDNLQNLARRNVQDLMKLKLEGLGQAKASAIIAAFELGRRYQAGISGERPVFKEASTAARFLQPLLGDYNYEVFAVLYLDQANGLIHHEKISEGGITSTYVDPRRILKRALAEDAVSIILAHNHPSGSLHPSPADKSLTVEISDGAKYLRIKLLDHIIVSRQGFFSFANEGILP